MSLLATIRAAIKAKAAAVRGFGVVHDYERYVREEAKFRELFCYTPTGQPEQVRGWWLRRSGMTERTLGVGRTLQERTWTLRGYMSLDDKAASELAFDELIEAFADAVRADPTLGGACEQSPLNGGDNTDGVQITDVGPVLFCGALCHSAVLELKTWSYL